MDLRNKVSMWVAGLNWFALPNLVVKADYTTRQIGTGKVFGTGPYTSEMNFLLAWPISAGFSRNDLLTPKKLLCI